MRLIDLFERRANPELNKKDSNYYYHNAALSFLDGKNLSEWGITMTNLPKLGINPQSRFDTPLGIYFYPAKYYAEIKYLGKILPFQDEAPYIQVFNFAGKVLSLSDLSKKEFELITQNLLNIYSDKSNYIERVIEDSEEEEGNDYGVRLWYIIGSIARNPVNWNSIIRKLGYSAVIDNGKSIIHENEPSQGLIVNPKAILSYKTFHDTMDNKELLLRKLKQAIDRNKPDLYLEKYIYRQPKLAVEYAVNVFKRFEKAEPFIIKYSTTDFDLVLFYAEHCIEDVYGNGWPELERYLIQIKNEVLLYDYANQILMLDEIKSNEWAASKMDS